MSLVNKILRGLMPNAGFTLFMLLSIYVGVIFALALIPAR